MLGVNGALSRVKFRIFGEENERQLPDEEGLVSPVGT